MKLPPPNIQSPSTAIPKRPPIWFTVLFVLATLAASWPLLFLFLVLIGVIA